MATTLRIAGIQMPVAREQSENEPLIHRWLERAANDRADWVLFPEMALTGYHGDFDAGEAEAGWKRFGLACREAGVNAILGTGARAGEACFIQTRAYNRQGELIGTHEKMVPTDGDRRWCTPGEELRVFESDGLRFGMLICNDLWVTPGCGPYPDPRLTYQLGRRGARLVFHAINSGSSATHIPYHESNLSLRAKESGFPIATANAAKENPVNAASGIVGADGEWVVQAPRLGEQIYVGEVEIE